MILESKLSWAGANKGLIQGGCHTENPSKGSTTVEDDIYSKKKQRTTGAFGEVSSVRLSVCSELYMIQQ
jgi:hypothetical protein